MTGKEELEVIQKLMRMLGKSKIEVINTSFFDTMIELMELVEKQEKLMELWLKS